MKKEENYKKLYDFLVESGEIKTIQKMSGVWEKDKQKFIRYQTELEDLANVIEIDETE